VALAAVSCLGLLLKWLLWKCAQRRSLSTGAANTLKAVFRLQSLLFLSPWSI